MRRSMEEGSSGLGNCVPIVVGEGVGTSPAVPVGGRGCWMSWPVWGVGAPPNAGNRGTPPGVDKGAGPVGAKAGRHGTAPGAPGAALGWPGNPSVDRGGQGTAPGAPEVAPDGLVCPGVAREEP